MPKYISLTILCIFSLFFSGVTVLGVTYVVAKSGGDATSIQTALNSAAAGDSILVRQKSEPYSEKLKILSGGNYSAGFISLLAYPGERPTIDGRGISGSDMILISNCDYIRIVGFEICNNLNVHDGSGIRIIGHGSNIEIRNNIIHDIRGRDAMGITVYGTDALPISNLLIDGNEIYDCEPAQSEALVLNGNVTGFEVTNNIVRDINNIGIDFIGGEQGINPNTALVARNGICRGNKVYNANSNIGGGYAAGIYVDGGRDIIVENNIVTGSDLGIEIGAENSGTTTTGIIVRNNIIYSNDKVGIIFGGYSPTAGRVRECSFLNNTCYKNDILGMGWGEIVIQYAEQNIVKNNIFVCTAQNILLYSETGNLDNSFDYNIWYNESGSVHARYIWIGQQHDSFVSFQKGSGQGKSSQFSDPLFRNPGRADFHIQAASPAVDMGDLHYELGSDEVDMDNEPRIFGKSVDVGADEFHPPPLPDDLKKRK